MKQSPRRCRKSLLHIISFSSVTVKCPAVMLDIALFGTTPDKKSAVQGIAVMPSGHFSVSTLLYCPGDGNQTKNNVIAY